MRYVVVAERRMSRGILYGIFIGKSMERENTPQAAEERNLAGIMWGCGEQRVGSGAAPPVNPITKGTT